MLLHLNTSRPVADEEGFTLVELLVGAVIGLIVLGTVVMLLVSSIQAQPRISDRSHAIQEGRALQERLTRELRVSYSVQSASPSSISFLTYLHRTSCGGATSTATAIQCRVTYTCAAGACTRAEGPTTGGAVDTDTLLTGISNASAVFCYSAMSNPCPAPPAASAISFVGVKLVYPAEEPNEDAITLEDGTALRNT
jgi:Tfp pilus assembly protein PilW